MRPTTSKTPRACSPVLSIAWIALAVLAASCSNAPSVSVMGSPAVSLSTNSLTFQSQSVGTTSASQPVTLTNTGNATLTISSIALTGADPGDFGISGNCGASLAAGAMCTANITFTPSATGGRSASVSITDNAPGSPHSVALTGTGANPMPTLTTLVPPSAVAGTAQQTLTINGTGFLPTSTVTYNGVGHAAQFLSATQLTILLTANDQATAGMYPVVVTNPAPGGGSSAPVNFTVQNPGLTLTSLSPPSAIAGAAAQTLTLNGSNFVPTSTVTYNNVAHAATFVNSNKLTIQLSAGDQAMAGNFAVVVTNPPPGGGSSLPVNFTVLNPMPSLNSLSPPTAIVGTGQQTLTLNGTGFVTTSTVTYNNVGHVATFVNSTQLTIQLSAADQNMAGMFPVVVTNPNPGGSSSSPVNFTVLAAGAIVGLAPNTLTFGFQTVTTTSPSQMITLSNTGNAAANITSVTIAGTNPGDFNETDNCVGSVGPGGNCTINVTFTPAGTGNRTAILSLVDDAGGSPPTVSITATGTSASGQFITLDPTKKFLVNSITGDPVFVTGENAFGLITTLNNTDLETYLADRAGRGFNAVWVAAADNVHQPTPPNNANGDPPFNGGTDFLNENANYWAHVDFVVQRAQAYGITVMLSPGFVGLNTASGYFTSYQTALPATMTSYGTFLGARYARYSNIVWVIGGDADMSQAAIYTNLNTLAAAIAGSDPNHLITFEASQGNSSLDALPGPPAFLSLNWVYQTQPTVVSGCQSNYSRSPFLPPLMGHDFYELENMLSAMQLRQEGYWAVLSGCYPGRVFGNNAIWTFNSPNSEIGTDPTWQSQLNSSGSQGQQYLGQLMATREHWLLVPDTTHSVLTMGFGAGPTLSVAARTSDGQTIIAYLSDGNATMKMIDMTQITSSVSMAKAWWYNPQTGAALLIGSFSTSGSQSFTAPDGNDWVLVIDDAAANLPAPGGAPTVAYVNGVLKMPLSSITVPIPAAYNSGSGIPAGHGIIVWGATTATSSTCGAPNCIMKVTDSKGNSNYTTLQVIDDVGDNVDNFLAVGIANNALSGNGSDSVTCNYFKNDGVTPVVGNSYCRVFDLSAIAPTNFVDSSNAATAFSTALNAGALTVTPGNRDVIFAIWDVGPTPATQSPGPGFTQILAAADLAGGSQFAQFKQANTGTTPTMTISPATTYFGLSVAIVVPH